MKPNSLLIVGCGDLGARTGELLRCCGYDLGGVCRNTSRLPADFTAYSADYCEMGSLAFLEDAAPDYLLLTLKPTEFSAQGYQRGFPQAMANVLSGLGAHQPKAIFMVSSTRVFAERDGGWVDEESPLAQEGYAAKAIIEAEEMLQNSRHSSCIIRFAGIYGDPEGRLITRLGRGEVCARTPLKYSNRIHRDDCAGFIVHLLALGHSDRLSVYIGVDSQPVPGYEVEQWLARKINPDAILTEMGSVTMRSLGHKRCSNRCLLASGYRLQYAGYQVGYGAVVAARTAIGKE
jgi:nucleoside-diphosphate-sugar epimerase